MNLSKLPIHYVYKQIHPVTKECFYVGHGRFERAWRCTSSGDETNYGHRNKDHAEFLLSLQLDGYIPTDWVTILHKNLVKTEACMLEQEYIRDLKPEFNRPLGYTQLKIKGELLNRVKDLRLDGLSYEEISKKVGISTMTVWRTLNGKNKNSG